jgi:hypothetical protein
VKWLNMLACGLAAALFYGAEPRIAFFISAGLLAVSFASFCLLYDEPLRRAGHRIHQRMGQISGQGIHADEYQRLQSMKVTTTEADREFQLTFVSAVNVGSGVAGAAMLVWALIVRIW